MGAFEPDGAAEHALAQRGDRLGDTDAARPPLGFDRGDAVDQSPAGFRAMPQRGEGESAQFHHQPAGGNTA